MSVSEARVEELPAWHCLPGNVLKIVLNDLYMDKRWHFLLDHRWTSCDSFNQRSSLFIQSCRHIKRWKPYTWHLHHDRPGKLSLSSSYLTQHSMSHTVSVLTLWPLLKDSHTVVAEMQSVYTLPLSGSITFVITVMHLTGPAHLED